MKRLEATSRALLPFVALPSFLPCDTAIIASRGHGKKASHWREIGLSTDSKPTSAFDSTTSRTMRNKFVFINYSVSGILLL
jgi:hypothetical protein